MTTTGPTSSPAADLSRVTESLDMIKPRWSVWVLMTLAAQPLRYSEIKSQLPWLNDGTLHPRLRVLAEDGLVERTSYGRRHVTYGLTSRGTDLLPVLKTIEAWGERHLEKETVDSQPVPTAAAQNIEDSLLLITSRHATPILWALRERGATTAKALASVAMPGLTWHNVYPLLDRLALDGLVAANRDGEYTLTASGRSLAPVYQALSAWANAQPLAQAQAHAHPVWGEAQELGPSQAASGTWFTHPSTTPAAQLDAATRARAASWRSKDLFSDQIPARPLSAPAGGPRR